MLDEIGASEFWGGRFVEPPACFVVCGEGVVGGCAALSKPLLTLEKDDFGNHTKDTDRADGGVSVPESQFRHIKEIHAIPTRN